MCCFICLKTFLLEIFIIFYKIDLRYVKKNNSMLSWFTNQLAPVI